MSVVPPHVPPPWVDVLWCCVITSGYLHRMDFRVTGLDYKCGCG